MAPDEVATKMIFQEHSITPCQCVSSRVNGFTKVDTVGEPCFQRDASSRADNTNSSSELTFDPNEGFANSIF
jgi:hypothetical protein